MIEDMQLQRDDHDIEPEGEDPGAGDAVNEPAPAPERLSSVLRRLAAREVEKLTLGDISRALKDRGFGALMILFCAPNLIIMPPGVSTIFGLPMMFVAIQLIIGYRKPLLPKKIRFRELKIGTFRNIVARMEPWIMRFERLARPRLWLLPQRMAEQIVGAVSLLMGLILILPIPLGNFPPAVAVIVMCLGLGERDGVWTGAGLLVAILAVGITIGVLATAGAAMFSIF
jgi:hypothetical protein